MLATAWVQKDGPKINQSALSLRPLQRRLRQDEGTWTVFPSWGKCWILAVLGLELVSVTCWTLWHYSCQACRTKFSQILAYSFHRVCSTGSWTTLASDWGFPLWIRCSRAENLQQVYPKPPASRAFGWIETGKSTSLLASFHTIHLTTCRVWRK